MRDFGNEDGGDEMLNSGNAHFVCLGVLRCAEEICVLRCAEEVASA